MNLKFGYIPDTPDRRHQQPAARHTLIAARLQAQQLGGDLSVHECPILNQGSSGSCGGHGSAQLISTALSAASLPLPWTPSPRGIYGNTRAVNRAAATPTGDLPPLTDSGIMPSDLQPALSKFGVRAMSPTATPDGRHSDVWTTADTGSEENVNDEATVEELEAEGFTVVTGEYRIDETLPVEQLAEQCAAALAAGFPIGVGAFVDTAVMNTNGTTPLNEVNLNDPNGGGHWFAVTKVWRDSGLWLFRVANSWGEDYGDIGHFVFTQNWLKASASDIYPWAIARVSQHRGVALGGRYRRANS